MPTIFRLSAIIFFLSFFCICVSAKDIAVLVDIQEYYNSMTSLSANFEQVLHHRESGSTEQRKGSLFFKKALNIRWEVISPSKELWIVTEQDTWDFLPEEEVAYRYSSQNIKNAGGIIGLVTGQTSLEKEYDIKELGEEGAMLRLQLFPKEPSMQLVEAMIWVEKDGAIRKIRSVDFYGNITEIMLSNLKRNIELKSSLFTFKVPKGVEIEDLRNADMQKGIFQ